ncbi:allantoicase [Candidatus Puniceispirillum marinum]|uniref:Probable allantoicase n=1 Tax=Puniceispirillum marinum (strain IMCC1322) TaxID=488538 RepID=D5BTM1_PUNMI|nr:allantoicase [Candidatus Puniceispirillum marinum]ADE39618.1 allantoicase [Candidatus Puniceispirillum marinum IMCC1322]
MNNEFPPAEAMGLVNLASPRMGTEIHSVSDDFFAEAPRMLADTVPVFVPDKFDDHGKWMDGWESRRRRHGGHDWCILHLGETGTIRLVDVNTAHFTGNYPPGAMLEAAYCPDGDIGKADWKTVIGETKLGPDAHHLLTAHDVGPVNIVRLNIYPDGGIARLRLFGDVQRDWSGLGDTPVELSALRSGGCILGYNDAHYGDVNALISEGRGQTMGDGWETRRRREPGHDWIVVRLGATGLISDIEVDTAHFKGNYPDRCSLQAALIEGEVDLDAAENWPELMGEKSLSADNIHKFNHADLNDVGPINVVRLNIFPDGGVSRLRLFGKVVT